MARKVIGIARNVAGVPGSWRRRWATLITLAIIAGAGVLFVQTVLAVKDAGLIQLDGDASASTITVATTNPAAMDDWDNVCYEAVQKPLSAGGLNLSAADAAVKCGTNLPTAGGGDGAIAVSWVEEPNPASSIFTGGGSKDPQDIPNWLWKDDANNPPDKDNIVNAYAARYQVAPSATCPNGTQNNDPSKPCDVLFFGLDRFDASGDANTGFWFFQKKVSTTNVSSQGGLKFDGLHTPGDVLVISGFSNGGTEASFSVYKWDPFCAADGKNENPSGSNNDPACKADNLRLQASLEDAAAACLTSAPGGQGCGIVNPSTITMPWAFVNKSGTPGNAALNGEFFEAGINLTLLNLQEGCFQSVLAETRSSTSPTSVLKDFVLGGFGECETTLTTTASLHANGTTITAGNGSDSGTASSGTDTAVLSIKGVTTWSGELKFYLCGPFAAPAVCDANGVLVTTNTVSNTSAASDFISGSATLTSAGRYCWFASFTPDAATAAKGVQSATHNGSGGSVNTECFNVSGVLPVLTTQAGTGPVAFGQPITDTATIIGLAKEPGNNGSNTTYNTINASNGVFVGSITFTLGGPGIANCTSTPSGFTGITPVAIVSTAGNATYGPVQFTPQAPGVYYWKAQYTNTNAINNSATSTHNADCTVAAERVEVQQIPSLISTAPLGYPQDTAKIKGANGSNLPPGGTVVFKLYDSAANCKADTGAVYTKTVTNVVPASPATNEVTGITTDNTTYSIDLSAGKNSTTHYWTVTYTPPAGSSHTGIASTCVESTMMTHVGHAYPAS